MTEQRGGTSRRGFLRGAAVGAAGVAGAGGATGTAGAQEDGNGGGDGDGGGSKTVDMTDGLVFEPATIKVTPGTTVVWENVGTVGHTVTAYEDDIPDDATYFASGGFDSEQAARDGYSSNSAGDIPGGESYEHTFEVLGTYEYFCIPHEPAGMIGTIEVVESIETPAPTGPVIPESAKLLGIATTVAMFSTLGLAYTFLKYGGPGPD